MILLDNIEAQLRDLKKAYGEVVLELKFRKK